jgi:hypothetical protein
MATQKEGSIISGIFWMLLISILLFWLPGFGPLIAGFVGGKKSGGVLNAIIAVILPAIVLGICLFLFTSLLTGAPIIGFVAGAGSSILVLSNVGPLLIGAIIGGILD